MSITDFDPNGPGLDNGNFIGLPFTEAGADLVFFPVPWDVTVSYADGTANGPANILQASTQLDLVHPFSTDAWKKGLYFQPINTYWAKRSAELRPVAQAYIEFIEQGGKVEENKKMTRALEEINYTCENLHRWVEQETGKLLQQGKSVGLIGGEHSCPLGYLRALAKEHKRFGILQIDAHLDLREAYEGFTYSHASIFYNALQIEAVQQLTQVGIRDYCQAEVELSQGEERIKVFYDYTLKQALFKGNPWEQLCRSIVDTLPEKVYISFDIDGLQPELCPHTGTPVPGGLSYNQALFLIETLMQSGRKIIGFDLCETAGTPHEWDGNVGARVAYTLAVAMLR
jgi:agmatinase